MPFLRRSDNPEKKENYLARRLAQALQNVKKKREKKLEKKLDKEHVFWYNWGMNKKKTQIYIQNLYIKKIHDNA